MFHNFEDSVTSNVPFFCNTTRLDQINPFEDKFRLFVQKPGCTLKSLSKLALNILGITHSPSNINKILQSPSSININNYQFTKDSFDISS
jgi:hypothetical protein